MYTRNISIHSFIQSQDFISTKNYLTYNKCLEQRLIDVGIQMKGLLNLYSNSMRVQHLDLYLKKYSLDSSQETSSWPLRFMFWPKSACSAIRTPSTLCNQFTRN